MILASPMNFSPKQPNGKSELHNIYSAPISIFKVVFTFFIYSFTLI